MRISRRPISTSTGGVLVELGWRSAQGGWTPGTCRSWPPLERVDGQTGPCQQAAQVVDARELAHGVEAAVEDAVAVLQVGQADAGGTRRRPSSAGEGPSVGPPEASSPHPFEPRRVLPDEQLGGEVQGVEGAGERPQLRLVDLQAHHLAHPQLHPVQAHRPVVVEVGQHEEQGHLGRGAWEPGPPSFHVGC